MDLGGVDEVRVIKVQRIARIIRPDHESTRQPVAKWLAALNVAVAFP